MIARDVMRTEVFFVRADDSVRQAAETMLDCGYGVLPVLDDEDNVTALISEVDVLAISIPEYLRSVADLSFVPKSLSFPAPGGRDLDTTAVREIARTDILAVVDEDEPVLEVVRIMIDDNVRRCPVVRDGKLVGIISRRDLVELIVKPTLEATASS